MSFSIFQLMHTLLKMVEVTIDLTVLKTVASALYYKIIPIIINIILFFYRISRCIFILLLHYSNSFYHCKSIWNYMRWSRGSKLHHIFIDERKNKKYAIWYYLMISTLCNVQQTCAVDLGASNIKSLTFSVS